MLINSSSWAIYALTKQGAEIALKLKQGFEISKKTGQLSLFLPARLEPFNGADSFFQSLREALSKNFNNFQGHLVVGATGLVVRHIAPLIKSKKDDPAVVVISQDGRWAISLLSGHLGGANQLAIEAANILGGEAVISTATDVENLPAVEMLAREAGLEIEDFSKLPAVSRYLVEGEIIPLYDPGAFLLPLINENNTWAKRFKVLQAAPSEDLSEPHIIVDFRQNFKKEGAALIMRPKVLTLGLGCHKGINPKAMSSFVKEKMAEFALAEKSILALASVEIRENEPALLELSRELNCPIFFFEKDELEKIETPNPSATVLRRIGVPSVCEAAAILAARKSGEEAINSLPGRAANESKTLRLCKAPSVQKKDIHEKQNIKLIVKKQKGLGATFAAAIVPFKA